MSTPEQKKQRHERALAIQERQKKAAALVDEYRKDHPELFTLAHNPFARVTTSLMDTSGLPGVEEKNLRLLKDLNTTGGRQKLFGEMIKKLSNIPPDMMYCEDPDKILDFEEQNPGLLYFGFELYNVCEKMKEDPSTALSKDTDDFMDAYIGVLQQPSTALNYIKIMADDIYLKDDFPEDADENGYIKYLQENDKTNASVNLFGAFVDMGTLHKTNKTIREKCPELLNTDFMQDIFSYRFIDEGGQEIKKISKAVDNIIAGKQVTPQKRTDEQTAAFKKILENPCRSPYIQKFDERTRTAYEGVKGVGASILSQDKVVAAGSKGSFFGGLEVTADIKRQLEGQPVSECLRFTPSGDRFIAEYRLPEVGTASNGQPLEIRKNTNLLIKAMVDLYFDEKGNFNSDLPGDTLISLQLDTLGDIISPLTDDPAQLEADKQNAVPVVLDALKVKDEAVRTQLKDYLLADGANFNQLFVLLTAVSKGVESLECYSAMKELMGRPDNQLTDAQKETIKKGLPDYENTLVNYKQIHESNPLTDSRMLLPMECGAFGAINEIMCEQLNRRLSAEGKPTLSGHHEVIQFKDPEVPVPGKLPIFFRHNVFYVDNVGIGNRELTLTIESSAPPAGNVMFNPSQKMAALGLYDSKDDFKKIYNDNALISVDIPVRELRYLSDSAASELHAKKGLDHTMKKGLDFSFSAQEYGPVKADPDAELDLNMDMQALAARPKDEYLKELVTDCYLRLKNSGRISATQYEANVNRFNVRFDSGKPSEADLFRSIPEEKFYIRCERFRKAPDYAVLNSLYRKEAVAERYEDKAAEAENPSSMYVDAMFAPKTDSSRIPMELDAGVEEFRKAQEEADSIELKLPEGISEKTATLAAIGVFFRDDVIGESYEKALTFSHGSTLVNLKSSGFGARENFFVNMLSGHELRANANTSRLVVPKARRMTQDILDSYAKGDKAPLAEALRNTFDACMKKIASSTKRDELFDFCADKAEAAAKVLESDEFKDGNELDKDTLKLLKSFSVQRDLTLEKRRLAKEVSDRIQIGVPYDDMARPFRDPQISSRVKRYLAIDLIERDIKAHNEGLANARSVRLFSSSEPEKTGRELCVFEDMLLENKELLIKSVIDNIDGGPVQESAERADLCKMLAIVDSSPDWGRKLARGMFGFKERIENINVSLASFAKEHENDELAEQSAAVMAVVDKYNRLKEAGLTGEEEIRKMIPDYDALGNTLRNVPSLSITRIMKITNLEKRDSMLSFASLCDSLKADSLTMTADSSIGGRNMERRVLISARRKGAVLSPSCAEFLDGQYKDAVIDALKKRFGQDIAEGAPVSEIKDEKNNDSLGKNYSADLITNLCHKAEERKPVTIEGKQYFISFGERAFEPVAPVSEYAKAAERLAGELAQTDSWVSSDTQAYVNFKAKLADTAAGLKEMSESDDPEDRLFTKVAAVLKDAADYAKAYQESHSDIKSLSDRQKSRLAVMNRVIDLAGMAESRVYAPNDLKYRLVEAVTSGESIDMQNSRSAEMRAEGRLRQLAPEYHERAAKAVAASPAFEYMTRGKSNEELEAMLRHKAENLFKAYKQAGNVLAEERARASRVSSAPQAGNNEPEGPAAGN